MRRILAVIWGCVLVLALWWVLAVLVDSPALPTPGKTLTTALNALPKIWPEFLVSAWRIIIAMLIGTLLALPLGLFLGRSSRANEIFGPALSILYPLPKIVLLPVLFVLLGIGGESKITLIAIAVFFQALVTMRDAAMQVPKETIESAESFGASRFQVITHVVFPLTLPALFTSLRLTTGTSIAILFVSEGMAGSTGLGYYIMHSWSMLEYANMFAGIVAMSLMGIAIYEVFDLAEKRLTRWREA